MATKKINMLVNKNGKFLPKESEMDWKYYD